MEQMSKAESATSAPGDQQSRLEVLEARIQAAVTRIDTQAETIEALEDELQDERDERERVEAELDKVRAELDDLDARTDLLQLVENSDEMTGKQRSVALVQHLKRGAERERDRGRDAKASVNRDEAERALQFPDVHRTTIFDDMRRAADLVDNKDVLWYDSASGGESRLRLNLQSGDLPNVKARVNRSG